MRTLIAGAVGYPVAVVLLYLTTPLGVIDALFLALLLELLPALSVVQARLARDMDFEKTQAYLTSAATIVVLGVVGLGLGWRLVGRQGVGLGWPIMPGDVAWTLGLLVGGVGTLLAFRAVRHLQGTSESRLVRGLMPTTPSEKWLFAGLSVCAGFGEELAYRGYALSALALATGSVVPALILTSVAFGILHSYQGLLGVTRTGVVGLMMGAVFVYTGSLWPTVFAHTLIDLVAGLVLRERLMA